jgi:RNA polymerase sigma-70 factor (ECF subfamily)
VVAQARLGREAAYRELVRRYERPIFSLIYRMVRDRKIANNAAIDHLRKRELATLSIEGSPHARTPDAMEATALQIGGRLPGPLDQLEARELGGAIEEAIGHLRPEYQSCILLRHVEGRPYEEIAEMMGLPLGTVKTYIHRARHELRKALAHLRE